MNDVLLLDRYFPSCPIKGSHDVGIMWYWEHPFLIPAKCRTCTMFNEASCSRCLGETLSSGSDQEEVDRHSMELDFGPCAVPNIPRVEKAQCVRNEDIRQVWVPAKCITCSHFTDEGTCARYSKQSNGLNCGLDFGGIDEEMAVTLIRSKGAPGS